jgi:hypothetical protein
LGGELKSRRGAAGHPYSGSMNRVVLTMVLITPILLVGVVMWGIAVLRPQMNAPPVGAGAKSTGGANAIGEYLAHGSAKRRDVEAAPEKAEPVGQKTSVEHLAAPESLAQGFVLVVTDTPGFAKAESPIYIACNQNNWNRADPAWKLSQEADGRWQLAVAHREKGEALVFRFVCAGREEADGKGGEISGRRLAVVDTSTLAPGKQPRIELSVSRWADRPSAGGADTKK